MPAGNHKIEKVTKELLKRYFENNITSEEKAVVSSWLNDSANKSEVLDYIESSWLQDSVQDSPVASFDSIYNKVVRESRGGAKVVPVRRKMVLWAASAAACILFLIVGTWIGFQLKRPQAVPDAWALSSASTGKGQRTKLLLNDGSEVYLNAETKLTLPDVHQVMYLEGEAYFNLKNTAKPVTIKTKGITTTTRKSSKINIKAFDNDSSVTVSVEKGNAEVTRNNETWPLMKLVPAKKNDSTVKAEGEEKPKILPLIKLLPPLHLRENQAMIFDKGNTGSGVISKMNAEQYSVWKDGIISFTNADSTEIINKLERWFGIEVYVTAARIRPYNAEFKNASLKEVLLHLGESLNVTCTIKGDAVYIADKK